MDPSTAHFGPTFTPDGALPNLKIASADSVEFNVHTRILLSASSNAFGGHLSRNPPPTTLSLPETSVSLDIIFHTIYAIPRIDTEHPLEATDTAMSALIKYGVSIPQRAAPTSPLGVLVLSYAPQRPIEAYALAAHHGLEALAVPISAHLLSYDFATLSDALAVKMGSVYFSRLFALQRTRLAALRDIVMRPPARHPTTATCGENAQRGVDRAWTFATAELAWNARAGIAAQTLAASFERAHVAVTCTDCQATVRGRIQEVATEWAAVKRTI